MTAALWSWDLPASVETYLDVVEHLHQFGHAWVAPDDWVNRCYGGGDTLPESRLRAWKRYRHDIAEAGVPHELRENSTDSVTRVEVRLTEDVRPWIDRIDARRSVERAERIARWSANRTRDDRMDARTGVISASRLADSEERTDRLLCLLADALAASDADADASASLLSEIAAGGDRPQLDLFGRLKAGA